MIPKYFFDLDGHDPDDTGEDLTDALEARKAAIELLGQVLEDDPMYALQGHWRVTISDRLRRQLYTVSVVVESTATVLGRE